uniref:unspecific monooxygenase n=1 Tax=Zygaena filipendulae TaxID=287375 RepID=A0A286MXM4_9NEOP|nr:cytochrome P450 CYP6AN19 [Zygaena filipendulae]
MFFVLILLLFVLIYLYSTRNHGYWSKRNVKHDFPVPLFGNHIRNQFGLKSITQITTELYNKYSDEKVVGYYTGTTPELIIRDPDIIRCILSVDFSCFYVRGMGRDPEKEPLLYSLFHVEGDQWKLLRQRLTPAFTTAKLKNMFPLIVNCAEKLHVVGEGIVSRGGECDVRELMARFTTEFIGACGFGIEMDSINNENSMFRNLGRLLFERSFTEIIKMNLYELFPELRYFICVRDANVEKSVFELVTKIREQRNNKPCGRNDFIDLLLAIEENGTIEGESIEKVDADNKPLKVEMEMDFKCMVAQVFVFFAAGFETSSSVTSYTLHELAYHPDIQARIQDEIDEVLSRYDNKFCYEAVAEMTLLEMALKEGLRLFPSLGVLNRVCTRRYTLPGTNVTIDPGVKIMIPVQALQTDEQYFKDAKEFRPERFSGEEGKKINKYTYLPFGVGPRACIGSRLGHMQSLAGLAALLQKFTVEPSTCTKRVPPIKPTSNVVQGVEGGLNLKMKLRNKVK